MQCAESLRVQAYFDGELDALSAAETERHSDGCDECRSRLRDLGQVRSMLRQHLNYLEAPPALRARVMEALDRETASTPAGGRGKRFRDWRPRPFWQGAVFGMGGTALAAGVAFFFLTPLFNQPLLDDLVSAHLRSLLPDHLIDVVSTDKHTVKPWFAGHADVSPVVADFDAQGYRLIGGRADYFDHQRAAVVVYRHGSHVINVFSWAARGGLGASNATRNGYHLVFWRKGNLEYCAISDTGWDKLNALVRMLQDVDAG